MKRRLSVILVAVAAALSLLPATPAAATDLTFVGHMPDAILQTESDQLAYHSQPEPCRVDFAAAAGTVVVDAGVGALRAQDHATASAECVSLDPNTRYTTSFEIVFQYYDTATRQFIDIPETRTTCSRPSLAGQGAAPCAHPYIYAFDHPSLDKIHRARARLLQPFQGTNNYSDPFITVDPSDLQPERPGIALKCVADVEAARTGEYETDRVWVKSQLVANSLVACSGDPGGSDTGSWFWVHQRLTIQRWNTATASWQDNESVTCWSQSLAAQAVAPCTIETVETSDQAGRRFRARLEVFSPVQMTRYSASAAIVDVTS